MAKPFDNPFSRSTFSFIRALKKNNDRDWFKANKSRYEETMKDPALVFITGFAAPLAKLSPHFRAIPKAVGGSLFRIYRDTRFGKDKTPYKTHLGIQFRHEVGKDVHAPGYYIHLEPKGSFLGVGLWRPDSTHVRKIREAIVERAAAWKKATRGKRFTANFELAGESLKRIPRGFDAEHPLAEDLRRKDFIAVRNLSDAEALAVDFPKTVATAFKDAAPLLRFLCEAVDVPY